LIVEHIIGIDSMKYDCSLQNYDGKNGFAEIFKILAGYRLEK